MIEILAWHILVHGYGFMYPYVVNGEAVHVNTFIASMLATLLVPATYCFVFISGYYDDEGRKPMAAINLWLCCLLSSTLIALVNIITGEQECTLRYISSSLRPITTFRWWFMSYFLIIVILSPILCKGISHISKKSMKTIICFLLLYNWVQIFRFEPMKGLDFTGLLTMWLVARYMKMYKSEISMKWSITLFFFFWGTLFLLFYLTYGHIDYLKSFALLSYNTPVNMIMAGALFFTVKNMKPKYNRKINAFLKPTLFIYLLTEGIGISFYRYLQHLLANGGNIFFIILIPFVCILVGHVLLAIANLITNRLSSVVNI